MITTEQKQWTEKGGWQTRGTRALKGKPQLVLGFGAGDIVKRKDLYEEIAGWYPDAHILLASTAGEILDTSVSDNTLSLTAVAFEKTALKYARVNDVSIDESWKVGETLAHSLPHEGLIHALLFSDGLHVNGTELVRGIMSVLPKSVSVTGGLVGDAANFKHTYLGLDAPATENQAVLVGLYGSSLRVGYGSMGGWDAFGPERTITKSKGSVLYELDGESALDLYKKYLGEQAKDLPASGLLFPLSVEQKTDAGTIGVVRTLLAVDESQQSMTFAGSIPEGAKAKLMKANFDRLVDGASGAASMSIESMRESGPELALLISCVGRKLVLKEHIEDETEAVREAVGADAAMCGFYSYGEISPTAPTEKQCHLHNQTMTITILKEASS